MKNSSLDARDQLSGSHISISNNTILQVIKKVKPIINYNATNIAIDNFSCRKRKTYYSILVDNDTKKRLDVVPSRQKPEVMKSKQEITRILKKNTASFIIKYERNRMFYFFLFVLHSAGMEGDYGSKSLITSESGNGPRTFIFSRT